MQFGKKRWLSCKTASDKKRLKEEHCIKRRNFNKLRRKAKQKYQLHQQKMKNNELHDMENPRAFWKDIGKPGLARERKTCIPMEVVDQNKQVKTDTNEVLHQWKSEYERMFNDKNDEAFDQEHLKQITSSMKNPDSDIFPKLDCTSLNSPITLEEVKHAVYHARLRNAAGCENIPADILCNEHCINILFKIVKFAFEAGSVPSQWQKGIINPIAKDGDPRCPLNCRPITLLSVPC